jgi:hypothetical protein
MGKITFNLAQSSLSPGWDPNNAEHDALWQNFAAGYSYSIVGSATQYDSLRGSDPATGGTSDTFSSSAGSLDLQAHNFAGRTSLDWSDNGDTATLALDSAWNTIKNAYVSDFTGHKLVLENWVDAWVNLDNDFGQDVVIDGSKRAEITTGSGDDTVWVGVDSNGAGWTNHIAVSTGAGDDLITITTSTRDYSGSSFAAAYDPHWTTSTVDAGSGADIIAGGGGNDTVDAGAGADVFVLHGARAFYEITTVNNVTTVQDLRSGAANQDGTDTLTRVETLRFADQTVALVVQPHTIDVSHLAASDGFAILAPDAANSGQAGASVAGGGDFNGDGLADLIIGAPAAGNGSGAAYLVYGHASGDVDLSSPGAGASLLTVAGDTQFGNSVTSLGDFNGDGRDDLLVLDHAAAGSSLPTAYVVFGQPGGFGASQDLASSTAVYKIALDAPFNEGEFRQVVKAGDINGDGLDDVLLTSTDTPQWKSYVVYGTTQTVDGTTLNHLAGTFPDYTRPVGDINGDGLADLAYLNRYGVDGFPRYAIEVVYGSPEPSQIDNFHPAYLFGLGSLVFDIETAGDFNGDGLGDIVAAFNVLNTNTSPAAATVVMSGTPSDPLAHILTILAGTNSSLGIYHAVSLGDVNHDGSDDIGLTHVGSSDAYVVFGRPEGTISLDDVATGHGGFKITGDTLAPGSAIFQIAGAGDVNGDGIDDIVLGGTAQHAGYVIFGHGDWAV